MNDTQLLQGFLSGSENDFRTIVERHLPLVLGTARRITGNNGLAEDVAQTVFILLARKAGSLSSGTILSGWLYRTTSFVARRALCSEGRRQRRETEAARMYDENDQDPTWKRIAPELDVALSGLGESDRTALLLRFFNDRPLREVGATLGISEEAAKKRVARALDKLRGALRQRGAEVSLAALIMGLTREGGQAATGDLCAQVAATAIATGSGVIASSALLTEVLGALHLAKVKTVVLTTAVAGVIALLVSTVLVKSTTSETKADRHSVSSWLAQLKQSRQNKNDAPLRETNGASSTELDHKGLRVIVLDNASSKPLSGVKVMPGADEHEGQIPLITDRDGTVNIDIPTSLPFAQRMNQYPVWLKAEGYGSREIEWLSSTGNVLSTVWSNYTVRLSKGIQLSGTVVSDEGQPLQSVKIKASGSNSRGYIVSSSDGVVTNPPEVRGEDFSIYNEKVTSDSAGTFVLPDYPADLSDLTLELTTSEGVLTKFRTPRANMLTSDDALEVSFQDLKNGMARLAIPKGVTVRGKVVDANRFPVEGAIVVEATQWGNLKVNSETRTDSSGSFSLLNRPEREYILAASADGHASASVVVAVEQGMKPVEIQLPSEQPLRGKLVDEAGSPQGGAEVLLVDFYNPELGFVWSTKTDDDGRFSWLAAPTNELVLSISSKGNYRVIRMKPSTNEQVIVLPGADSKIRITGKVLDAQSKKTLPKFQVGVILGYSGPDHDEAGSTIAGRNGVFEVELSHSDFPIEKLDSWSFRVEAAGYETTVTEPHPWGEGSQEITIELHTGGPIEGAVSTPDGEPAAACQVALAGFADSAFSPDVGKLQPNAAPAKRADKRGRFKLEREMNMTNVVAFHESGWAAPAIPEAGKKMTIQLHPWSRIEGTLRLGGVAQGGAEIKLKNLVFDLANPIMIAHEVMTDEKGHFVFEQVPAGDYELSLGSTNVRQADGSEKSTLQTAVTVAVGETKTVEMGSSGVSVVGRLHMPPGVGTAWSNAIAILSLDVPLPKDPPRSRFVREEAHRAARLAFARDPQVLAQLGAARNYAGRISDDGYVRFEHIPAGRYYLEVTVFDDLRPKSSPSQRNREVLAQTKALILVPQTDDGAESIVSFDDLTVEPY